MHVAPISPFIIIDPGLISDLEHDGYQGNHCNHQVNFSDTIPLRLLVIFRWEPAFLTLLSQDRVLVGKKMSECQTKAVLKNLKT